MTKARAAAGLFLLLLLTATCTEFFFHGRLSRPLDIAAGAVEVSCMIAVTLLFYSIFKPINSHLSLVAACFNALAVALEMAHFMPHGVNVGLGFHAFYWILIAYLISRSKFLLPFVGALFAIAGLCWLTLLLQPTTSYISRYSLAAAFIVEGAAMLSLLVTR